MISFSFISDYYNFVLFLQEIFMNEGFKVIYQLEKNIELDVQVFLVIFVGVEFYRVQDLNVEGLGFRLLLDFLFMSYTITGQLLIFQFSILVNIFRSMIQSLVL